jgi:transposase IS116/IS110/IS902 family protein
MAFRSIASVTVAVAQAYSSLHPEAQRRRSRSRSSARASPRDGRKRKSPPMRAFLWSGDQRLEQLVAAAAPRTIELFGVGTQAASQLLITAGQNIDRLRSEAAFAKICGAAPIQASSGRTTRHRLDYGGDRQANRALHMIAVCRLRHCDRTRAYAANEPPRASTDAKSSAASSATSPARPTTPSATTSKR